MYHRNEDFDDRDIMEMRDEPDAFEMTEGLEIVDDGEAFLPADELDEAIISEFEE